MKKFFFLLLCFLLIFTEPAAANPKSLKEGFYKVTDLTISENTTYTVQNISFNERIYVIIFDSHAQPLQGVRLKPQSKKYNLISLQPGYKIVLIGGGEINISPDIMLK
ncbi:hypothetical protein [Clostridium chromiireducens]|uniref:DUF3244 domain-containing protein n=1 Tax=Clostridium chromiireducens TaxID=225345 RepID=A0A1V4J1L8_9CLOT|nr:hypothetical protein [Clostridium chromiireducens]OPJ65924.1 hypothetical protein CLCHR_02800 [Clostridium chromiireducens]RII35402.1 hypothetical protein D2A34_09375 [Clostridium chromiireducens]